MLTDRQKQLHDFLRRYQRQHGVMPSTRDIQAHFGFASQTAAMGHLRALEKKGVIRRLAGKTKSEKHLKAEALIAKGRAIRIIAESDFRAIVATATG